MFVCQPLDTSNWVMNPAKHEIFLAPCYIFMNLGRMGLLESKSPTYMNDGLRGIILGRNLCLHDITNSPGAFFSGTTCTAPRVSGLVARLTELRVNPSRLQLLVPCCFDFSPNSQEAGH